MNIENDRTEKYYTGKDAILIDSWNRPSPPATSKTEFLNREKVKELVCNAIDNIPDIAGIDSVIVEHPFYSATATILINISLDQLCAKDAAHLEVFHQAAHDSFGTELDLDS